MYVQENIQHQVEDTHTYTAAIAFSSPYLFSATAALNRTPSGGGGSAPVSGTSSVEGAPVSGEQGDVVTPPPEGRTWITVRPEKYAIMCILHVSVYVCVCIMQVVYRVTQFGWISLVVGFIEYNFV